MKTAFVAATAIFSHIILCIIAWSVGAVTVAPFKFWWWGAGAAFLALVALQLRRELLIARNSTRPASSHYKKCDNITGAPVTAGYAGTMSVFTCIWSLTFAAVWLLGQEGAAIMSRPLETCLIVLVDLALKGGLFAYVLCAVEADAADADKELQVPLSS